VLDSNIAGHYLQFTGMEISNSSTANGSKNMHRQRPFAKYDTCYSTQSSK
jgi:hypothetical protein